MAWIWEEGWEDFYKLLGLNGGCEACAGVATADEVERAYHTTKSTILNLAAGGDGHDLLDRQLINVEWAHDVLSNPALRQNYDHRYFNMVSNCKKIALIGILRERRRWKRSRILELSHGEEGTADMVGEPEEAEDLLDPQVVKELSRLVVARLKLDGRGEEAGPAVFKTEGTRKRAALDFYSN